MSESTKYVAVANFSLNLDNGTKQLQIRVGDEMMFDGYQVECKGQSGQAYSLSKVIGEWIQPANGHTVIKSSAPMIDPSQRTRNATGGRAIEDSDVAHDLDVRSQQESSHEELTRLVTQYENTPPPTHISQRTTDDMADMRKESRVQVENHDAQEVAKVSSTEKTNAPVKNTSGVEIQDQKSRKTTVISNEERVVKKTAYNKKPEAPAEHKHLKVDKEGSGVEVRKVKSPTTHRNDVKTSTAESRREVSVEQDAVIETDYGTGTPTEVGSSTQAQIEHQRALGRPTTAVKRQVIAEASQDGVVVRKVSKMDEENMSTRDGITSRVTVSAGGELDAGEVTFSSNSEINEGEATFSKTEDAVTDLGGGGDDGEIDVNDILGSV